ncbi:MAG: ISAs1 family transposase [Methylocella sp.]
MPIGFLEKIEEIPDHRLAGMVSYPLDEILPTTLVGVLRGADDFEAIELLSREYLAWLRQFLPYKAGIPRAQTFRKVFRLLKPEVLERCLAAWVASLQDIARGVVAVDGKTPCGSNKAADGSGALHLLSAYACEAGLVIGPRAVNGESNEIKAIPELLEMLALNGAIVPIDAMGTQKAIAGKIVEQEADYVLALKGNQSSLHEDVKLFFEDAELANTCAVHKTASAGHGRIEERECRVADAAGWLQERHKGWQKLSSIAAIASTRIAKKTGQTSHETRFYITSLPADPAAILAATRAHWGIENNLHWQLDIAFDEDRCRTRADFAPLNLAVVRHIAFNILKRDTSKLFLKRKRLKASVNPDFRGRLLAC